MNQIPRENLNQRDPCQSHPSKDGYELFSKHQNNSKNYRDMPKKKITIKNPFTNKALDLQSLLDMKAPSNRKIQKIVNKDDILIIL